MKTNKRRVNQVIRISPINRQLNSVYETEQGRIEIPIVGVAQVIYTDGGFGFELMDARENGKVDFVGKILKELKSIRDLDEDKYINQRVGVPPSESVLGKREEPWNLDDNPFANRNARQFDDEKIPVENTTEGHIMRIQSGIDGSLCQCQNGLKYGCDTCSEKVARFYCSRCESSVKVTDCIHNNIYYDCPFCGCHLT